MPRVPGRRERVARGRAEVLQRFGRPVARQTCYTLIERTHRRGRAAAQATVSSLEQRAGGRRRDWPCEGFTRTTSAASDPLSTKLKKNNCRHCSSSVAGSSAAQAGRTASRAAGCPAAARRGAGLAGVAPDEDSSLKAWSAHCWDAQFVGGVLQTQWSAAASAPPLSLEGMLQQHPLGGTSSARIQKINLRI